MILVCEVMFDRVAHVPFNAGFLTTIRMAFPNEDLAFYGATAHLEQLKIQVGKTLAGSVHWNEILPIPPGPSYGTRFFQEVKLINNLLGKLPHGFTSRLILTSAFPSTVLAMKVARLFSSKNPQVQVVLHGLSGVTGKRRRHPLHRMQDMHSSLTLLGNRGIQYLVLEESIRDRVVERLPRVVLNIGSLDHPMSPNEGTNEVLDLDSPIRFGFLGTALKSKGYPLFVALADVIVEKYGRRAEFHVIGRGSLESREVQATRALATRPAAEQLTREDFVRGVTPLHFIILPYEMGRYSLTASGVLLDAIAWQKPIIARRIPTFQAMFAKHGDIGYLFDDDSELPGVVDEILQAADRSRYRCQALRLGDVRKSRDPETLATAYRSLCGLADAGSTR